MQDWLYSLLLLLLLLFLLPLPLSQTLIVHLPFTILRTAEFLGDEQE